MATSLLETLQGLIGPNVTRVASSALDEHEYGAGKTFDAAFAAILCGLERNVGDANLMGEVAKLIGDRSNDTAVLSNAGRGNGPRRWRVFAGPRNSNPATWTPSSVAATCWFQRDTTTKRSHSTDVLPKYPVTFSSSPPSTSTALGSHSSPVAQPAKETSESPI